MKRSDAMRGWALGLAVAVLAVLAGCGGGQRVDPFVPVRLVAFGDEASVIRSDGRKYTINGINTTSQVVDCGVYPSWVQYLASSFGMVFSQCSGGRTDFQASTYAAVGARVADVTNQITTYIANNAVGSKDLFTVYVGQNDLIAIYEDPTITDKRGAAEAAGTALAQQVNALAIAGGRVLFVAIPDLGLTPYAIAKSTTDPNAVATLSLLSERFNTKLSVGVINDGRMIGIVSAEEMTQAMQRLPSVYGIANATDAACTVALPNCDAITTNLVAGAAPTGYTYLWASDRQLGPAAHLRLGQIAETRAKNNPF